MVWLRVSDSVSPERFSECSEIKKILTAFLRFICREMAGEYQNVIFIISKKGYFPPIDHKNCSEIVNQASFLYFQKAKPIIQIYWELAIRIFLVLQLFYKCMSVDQIYYPVLIRCGLPLCQSPMESSNPSPITISELIYANLFSSSTLLINVWSIDLIQ